MSLFKSAYTRWSLIVIILVFMSGSTSTASEKRLGAWALPPNIEVCDDAPVQVDDLIVGTYWWASIGYKFGKISAAGDACKTGNVGGTIIIRGMPKSKSHIATTHFLVDDTGAVGWAKIYLPEIVLERVLEHELGHALGWEHINQDKHIMHSDYAKGGWNDSGVQLVERPTTDTLQSFPGAAAPRRGGLRD
jgi:hypothetical protein